jgi:hypothetical protein
VDSDDKHTGCLGALQVTAHVYNAWRWIDRLLSMHGVLVATACTSGSTRTESWRSDLVCLHAQSSGMQWTRRRRVWVYTMCLRRCTPTWRLEAHVKLTHAALHFPSTRYGQIELYSRQQGIAPQFPVPTPRPEAPLWCIPLQGHDTRRSPIHAGPRRHPACCSLMPQLRLSAR